MSSCSSVTSNELRQVRQRNYCCCGVIEARDGAFIISILWTLVILYFAVCTQSIYGFLPLAIPFSAFVGYFCEIHHPFMPIIILQMIATFANVVGLFLVIVAEISVTLQDDIYQFLKVQQVIAVPLIALLSVMTLFHVWITMTLTAAYRSVRDTRLLALMRYTETPEMEEPIFKPIILQP